MNTVCMTTTTTLLDKQERISTSKRPVGSCSLTRQHLIGCIVDSLARIRERSHRTLDSSSLEAVLLDELLTPMMMTQSLPCTASGRRPATVNAVLRSHSLDDMMLLAYDASTAASPDDIVSLRRKASPTIKGLDMALQSDPAATDKDTGDIVELSSSWPFDCAVHK
jgi:hypothetical protein